MSEHKQQNAALTKPHIIALANQKGGVGKTTTAVNLSTALASIKQKVLLIDLDPQGNASTGVGVDKEDRETGSFELLLNEVTGQQTVRQTQIKGLDVVVASMDLLGIEVELANNPRRLFVLKDALWKDNFAAAYDFIFIDCPPSLNMLTLNAMIVARSILVPLQCEFFALEGLSQLVSTITQVKQTLNKNLHMQGIVLTMYDSRSNLSSQVEEDVRGHFGRLVYDTVIPRNVRLSEAPSFGLPALLYDHKCVGSRAYIRLASELLHRMTTVAS